MVTKKDYLVPLLDIVAIDEDVLLASGQAVYGTDDVADYMWGGKLNEQGF